MLHIFQTAKKKLLLWSNWLWKQKGTPGQRARGLAIGVFSGSFPLFGLQTLIGIALAKTFKANLLLAGIGTWISNPFTYIPIYWINFKVGSFLIGASREQLTTERLNINEIWNQGWDVSIRLLLGSGIMGFLAAFLTYVIVYIRLTNLSKTIGKKNPKNLNNQSKTTPSNHL